MSKNFYDYMYGGGKTAVAQDADNAYDPQNPKPGKYGLSHEDGSPCDARTPDTCPEHRKARLAEKQKEDADTLQKGGDGNVLGKGIADLRAKGMSFRQIRDEAAKRANIANPDGGTFDLETGEPVKYKDGYQVAFQEDTTEDSSHSHHLSDDDYDRLVENLSKELGARPNLGTFGRPEISWHVDSLAKAMEICRRHNQESTYDWSTHGDTYTCIQNPDFVGETHTDSMNNEVTEKAQEHKKRKEAKMQEEQKGLADAPEQKPPTEHELEDMENKDKEN